MIVIGRNTLPLCYADVQLSFAHFFLKMRSIIGRGIHKRSLGSHHMLLIPILAGLHQMDQIAVHPLGVGCETVVFFVPDGQESRENYQIFHMLEIVPVVEELVQLVGHTLALVDVQIEMLQFLGLFRLFLCVFDPQRNITNIDAQLMFTSIFGFRFGFTDFVVRVLSEDNISSFIDVTVKKIQILEHLQEHRYYFLVLDIVSTHFIEHFIHLQQKSCQVQHFKSMIDNLDVHLLCITVFVPAFFFFLLPDRIFLGVVPDKDESVSMATHLLDVQEIHIHTVLFEVGINFPFLVLYLLCFLAIGCKIGAHGKFAQLLVKSITDAGMQDDQGFYTKRQIGSMEIF